MKQKITRESLGNDKLIFFPNSEDECIHLQHRLFELGFKWSGGDAVIQNAAAAAQNGLVLMNDAIYYRGTGDTTSYKVCSVEQLADDYIPPEQRFMIEMFNKLSAKIDALSEKVDRLYAEVHPDITDTKPGLARKPGGAP